MKKVLRKSVKLVTLASLALTQVVGVGINYNDTSLVYAQESEVDLSPKKGPAGYYVDVFEQNDNEYTDVESNPSIAVLSKMHEIFTPGRDSSEEAGDAWKNGTVLDEDIHMKNMEKTLEIVENATAEEVYDAYIYDRRSQNYTMIDGLGDYADEFKEGAEADTTIPDEIPEDAPEKVYKDEAEWAKEDSTYGEIVKLVGAVRGWYASTGSSKNYYQYARPFRWNTIDEKYPEINVIESLTMRPKPIEEANSDGGFPSGHTNAAYLAGFGLAYAMPEQYHSILLTASELGHSRIITGMHSPLDVIGGRVLAHAIASAKLNSANNNTVKANAYEQGRTILEKVDGTVDNERYRNDLEAFRNDSQLYLDRLTYGFEQTGETDVQANVPKGAEALLESRFPYMSAEERRMVLYTTALPSGYPLLDDEEGYGRINLFAAVSGYGSFPQDVIADVGSTQNGIDYWLNDIDGPGKLIKKGTDTLALGGRNTFTGGVEIKDGAIEVLDATSLGKGDVVLGAGTTLIISSDSDVTIEGNLEVGNEAKIIIAGDNKDVKLIVSGEVTIAEDAEVEEGLLAE